MARKTACEPLPAPAGLPGDAGHRGLGKAAGATCGRAGTSDVIDALVVVTALRLDALMVTSDPDDLQHLASSPRSKLALHTV